jgi:hypothetical protein
MFSQRLARFLPGRPGFVLILGIAALVVFAVGFGELALTRRGMVARYDAVQAKVERLEDQNRLLQEDLNRAQKDQHVPQRAWEYFGLAPKGTGVIVAEPQPLAEVQPATAVARTEVRDPFWQAWLRRLPLP